LSQMPYHTPINIWHNRMDCSRYSDLCTPVARNFRHGVHLNNLNTFTICPQNNTADVDQLCNIVPVSTKMNITSNTDSKSLRPMFPETYSQKNNEYVSISEL